MLTVQTTASQAWPKGQQEERSGGTAIASGSGLKERSLMIPLGQLNGWMGDSAPSPVGGYCMIIYGTIACRSINRR